MFLHAVEEGPASQSYGLQVAQLAGVPPAVIRAARRHLATLEAHSVQASPQFDLFALANAIDAEPPETDAGNDCSRCTMHSLMHWQGSSPMQ